MLNLQQLVISGSQQDHWKLRLQGKLPAGFKRDLLTTQHVRRWLCLQWGSLL
jgi:hypothetical protein